MESLGWNTLLFGLKWVFIGLVYFVLVVVLLNVRREFALRSRSGPADGASFSPGRLRIVNAGSDPKLRAGAVLELKPVTLLGALPDNDLVLRDRFISSHHARLSWDGVGWTVEDLGSRNGSAVNGQRLQPNSPMQLPDGAQLSMGDMIFELMESMILRQTLRAYRRVELLLLVAVFLMAGLGFTLVSAASRLQAGQPPFAGLVTVLLPLLPVAVLFGGLHLLLYLRRSRGDQMILPLVAAIFALGLIMIFRLRGSDGVWQQVLRGFLPGMLLAGVLVYRADLIERIRTWTIPISVLGLLLAFATALFGVVDESGARLSLRLGPLPAVQTSEVIKLTLIIFLAWFIDREGEEVEGRARTLFGFFRVPALRYFLPGILFVTLATLALVKMSDFGAVPILALIFVLMLFAGFETRVFATIGLIGLSLAALVGVVLAVSWHVPAHIQYRFLAFVDPWSSAEMIVNGQPSGITIAQGPGYQLQQAIYAIVAGGLTGRGLGFGVPTFIPLAATDFIFAALLEEMGAIVGLALLIFYLLLLLRILRSAVLLPRTLLFERLLLVGIGTHFFTQVLIMVGGTLNLIPMTGVTLPFLSLGGAALLVNLLELGLVLAITRRLEM